MNFYHSFYRNFRGKDQSQTENEARNLAETEKALAGDLITGTGVVFLEKKYINFVAEFVLHVALQHGHTFNVITTRIRVAFVSGKVKKRTRLSHPSDKHIPLCGSR